jgi:hypothetical protein
VPTILKRHYVSCAGGPKLCVPSGSGPEPEGADLRNLIAVPGLAGGLIAALITPAGTASASCDSADCVPNVTRNVVEGTPCVPQQVYDFGLDAEHNTFVCSNAGVWAPAGPLRGLRQVALPCDAINESAQGANGSSLMCAAINSALRWANRPDTPGPPRCFSAATSCLGTVPAQTWPPPIYPPPGG